ncbi:MAG: HNH endonuclease [Bacteroidetes bacterium]|nr:HNH endonuclease [Bacteroidota bacterium]
MSSISPFERKKPLKGKKVATQSFGSNHIDNLVIACANCNNHKKHRILRRAKFLKNLNERKFAAK